MAEDSITDPIDRAAAEAGVQLPDRPDEPCPYNVCSGSYGPDDDHEDCATQRQEMRAETFAAEALMGMRPGTTEGWYDEPEPPDPYDEDY